VDPIKGVEKLKKVKLYACSTGTREKVTPERRMKSEVTISEAKTRYE
jgi:hypothetical protein